MRLKLLTRPLHIFMHKDTISYPMLLSILRILETILQLPLQLIVCVFLYCIVRFGRFTTREDAYERISVGIFKYFNFVCICLVPTIHLHQVVAYGFLSLVLEPELYLQNNITLRQQNMSAIFCMKLAAVPQNTTFMFDFSTNHCQMRATAMLCR